MNYCSPWVTFYCTCACDLLLQVVQVLLQTPMIVDGLRRCSDSAENQGWRLDGQFSGLLEFEQLAIPGLVSELFTGRIYISLLRG